MVIVFIKRNMNKMGKVYVSSEQASDFVDEYKWWIVGILVLIIIGGIYYA